MKAVEVLMEHGVPEERIIFINLVRVPPRDSSRANCSLFQISCPEGLSNMCAKYPRLRVVSGYVCSCAYLQLHVRSLGGSIKGSMRRRTLFLVGSETSTRRHALTSRAQVWATSASDGKPLPMSQPAI